MRVCRLARQPACAADHRHRGRERQRGQLRGRSSRPRGKHQLSTEECHHLHGTCQLSTVNRQLSTVNRQPPTVNCQLSTVNCQLSHSYGGLTTSGPVLSYVPSYKFSHLPCNSAYLLTWELQIFFSLARTIMAKQIILND